MLLFILLFLAVGINADNAQEATEGDLLTAQQPPKDPKSQQVEEATQIQSMQANLGAPAYQKSKKLAPQGPTQIQQMQYTDFVDENGNRIRGIYKPKTIAEEIEIASDNAEQTVKKGAEFVQGAGKAIENFAPAIDKASEGIKGLSGLFTNIFGWGSKKRDY